MNCRDMIEFLMAYLDEELPEDERRRFDLHLGDCPPCVSYLETYRDTVKLGRCVCDAPDAPAPAEIPERLVQAILAARRSS
jgi:anti-sigma factor RsiW